MYIKDIKFLIYKIKYMKIKSSSIPLISYVSWWGVGFYRGVNYYKYKHNKYESKEPYFYISSIGYGFYGLGLYSNPILIPFTIYKELYRLEINIRNLEDEKNSDFYNEIL
jgi:hypothetical protein